MSKRTAAAIGGEVVAVATAALVVAYRTLRPGLPLFSTAPADTPGSGKKDKKKGGTSAAGDQQGGKKAKKGK